MSSHPRSVHFIGLGGIAMASVAAALKARGWQVTGSDQAVYSPAAEVLAEAGIRPHRGYDPAHLPVAPDLVVIGNALSRGNPEVEEVLARRWRYHSLPELLREHFLRGRRCLVVCGTHGKTTTASLLAWVFEHSGRQPSFLIGGRPRNFPVGARFTDSEWFILEGDEYDTAFFDKRSKFVHYEPEVALLNNLEFDHADIFDDLAAIQRSFNHLLRLVPRDGLVLANGDDPNLASLLDVPWCPVRRFGFGPGNGVRAEAVELGPAHSTFRVGEVSFQVNLAGQFNVRNALGVVACARHCGIADADLQAALSSFQGVERRLQVRGTADGVVVVDDFAHHPTALRETLGALRLRFPGQRLWAVFEPRSNTTRRRVFQRELADALRLADAVVVAPVAALERLNPADRLDPDQLIRDLQAGGRPAQHLPGVTEIVDFLSREVRPGEVVVGFSNGGFDGFHARLLAALEQRSSPLRG